MKVLFLHLNYQKTIHKKPLKYSEKKDISRFIHKFMVHLDCE